MIGQQIDQSVRNSMELMALELKANNSYRRMVRCLVAWRDAVLDEKYRPGQPRAPKGTPEGGQWIIDPSSGRQQRLSCERVRLSELTPFGNLDTEMLFPDGSRMCVYNFGSQKWIVAGGSGRHIGCVGRLHQSAVFPTGIRLNDN